MPIRNGNATVLREIPRPDTDLNGKILDKQGNTVSPVAPTIMARLNEKSKDEFTITKGMAAIFALCLTAFGLFVGYIVPTIKEGGRDSERLGGLETKVEQMSSKLDAMRDAQVAQQLRDAEKRGYELKAAEGSHK